MQNQPFHDVLGEYYQEINSKVAREQRGEFYTPPSISEMMVKMTMNVEEVIERGRPITVSDPSCGSGSMLLKVAKEFQPKEEGEPSHVDLLRVTAQDISPVACDMAYINLTAWGVPAKVIHGNTLSMEIWNEWRNIHWFRVGEDTREKLAQLKALMSNPSPEVEKKPAESLQGFVDSSDIRQKESEDGQFEFDL